MKLARLFPLLFVLLISACTKEPLHHEQAYVFGTLVDVSIYGAEQAQAQQATQAVMHEFQRLHDMLHAWKPSELGELNKAIAQGGGIHASHELAAMLRDAARVEAQSNKLFNPAIGSLIRLWGFQSEDFKPLLPDAKKIAAQVRAKPRMSDLYYLKPYTHDAPIPVFSHNKAVRIDLGGYAKGYALDRAMSILRERGIANALVNIGGNVMALGKHGGRPWVIGIQHPRRPGPIAVMELHDGEAIGTSGDYQRYFELDGKRYCHVIDPRTGYPVQGVQAVSILTRGDHAGLHSDAYSKPLFIAGAQGWQKAAKDMHLDEAMLIDGGGVVHLTAALQKRLKFTDETTPRKIVP